MENADELLQGKKAIFIGLDDVLYPEKDYDLQVFYLFAQFVELTEQRDCKELLKFLTAHYEIHKTEGAFDAISEKFSFVSKYQERYERLRKNAKLPLKLFLYQNVASFLTQAVAEDITIFIITDGNPELQLSKIKHLEWGAIANSVKVYFTEELQQNNNEVIQSLLTSNNLASSESLLVLQNKLDFEQSNLLNLPYVLLNDIN